MAKRERERESLVCVPRQADAGERHVRACGDQKRKIRAFWGNERSEKKIFGIHERLEEKQKQFSL